MRREEPQKFLGFYSKIAHTAYKNLICAYAQTLNFRMRQCINVQKNFCVSENLYAQRIKKACPMDKIRILIVQNGQIFA